MPSGEFPISSYSKALPLSVIQKTTAELPTSFFSRYPSSTRAFSRASALGLSRSISLCISLAVTTGSGCRATACITSSALTVGGLPIIANHTVGVVSYVLPDTLTRSVIYAGTNKYRPSKDASMLTGVGVERFAAGDKDPVDGWPHSNMIQNGPVAQEATVNGGIEHHEC